MSLSGTVNFTLSDCLATLSNTKFGGHNWKVSAKGMFSWNFLAHWQWLPRILCSHELSVIMGVIADNVVYVYKHCIWWHGLLMETYILQENWPICCSVVCKYKLTLTYIFYVGAVFVFIVYAGNHYNISYGNLKFYTEVYFNIIPMWLFVLNLAAIFMSLFNILIPCAPFVLWYKILK